MPAASQVVQQSVPLKLTDAQWEAYAQAKWEILVSADEVDSYVIFQLFGALQQIVSGFGTTN